jgi:hypothetical protein
MSQPEVGDLMVMTQIQRGQVWAGTREALQPEVGDLRAPIQFERGQLLAILREALQPGVGEFPAITQIQRGQVWAARQQVRQPGVGNVVTTVEEDRVGPTVVGIPPEKSVGDGHGEVLWAKIQDGAVTVQEEGLTRGLAVVFV